MSDLPPPTILDVAYDVLSRSEGPLSPHQIAMMARIEGYDVNGWDIKAEIDSDIQYLGYRSPFTQIGRDQYGIIPVNVPVGRLPVPSSVLRPVIAVVVMLIILMLVFFAYTNIPPGATAATLTRSQPPAAKAQPQPAQPANLDWWTANAMNQMSSETQEVSRQYLSNYYNTCGPAVIAMLTTFYRSHAEKPGDRVTPAKVLRDARQELGYFTPPYNSGLLEFRNLRDLFGLYGITQIYPEGDSWISFDDLLKRVRKGTPAVVGMRYGYQGENARYLPAGGSGIYDHFVIIFGTTEVNGKNYFWLYNSHPGKYLYEDSDAVPVKISFDEFKQSWQLNDDSEYSDYGPAAFYSMGS
jgi:hypothetical protein